MSLLAALASHIRRDAEAYKGGHDGPLGAFVGIMAAYAGAVSLCALAVRRRGVARRINATDLALVSVATHKLSRLLAKDPVTSP